MPVATGATKHENGFTPVGQRSPNSVFSKQYEKALETRMAERRRTQQLARRPNFQDTREAAESGTIYGSPDDVSAKLQALREIGAEYVLLNCPAGITTLRRFAKDVMPRFASDPQTAATPTRTAEPPQ